MKKFILILMLSSSAFAQVETDITAESINCLNIAQRAHEQKAAYLQLAFQDATGSEELLAVTRGMDRDRREAAKKCVRILGSIATELAFSSEGSFNQSRYCLNALISMRRDERAYSDRIAKAKYSDDYYLTEQTRMMAVRNNNTATCASDLKDRNLVQQMMLQF